MDDKEAKARQELDRAHRAKVILEDPLFTAAVEGIRNTFLKAFSESSLEDDRARLHARIGLGTLERLLKDLEYHIETGKFAAKTLEELGE